ncbi:MAG: SurA N-terminal domain-containing protein, partial [Magnetovibrio sp.]|nr:SurA N-terminal domain-containing protein [Magnetovibrio sp.]
MLGLALMLMVMPVLASISWAQSSLGIAAVVNDDVISMLDLNSRITMIVESSQMQKTPDARSRIAQQVLRGLIDEKLKVQETRRVGIKVSQTDIEDGLKHIAGNNKMTVAELTNQLMSIGVPITALTSRLEAELSWQKFVGRRLSKRIQIGAEEIKDEIARIQSNAGKPEYQLAEIYLPVDSPSQDSKVRATSQRLVVQLRQGAPFSALARNFSRSPSAAVDGDLGWVQPANLDQ